MVKLSPSRNRRNRHSRDRVPLDRAETGRTIACNLSCGWPQHEAITMKGIGSAHPPRSMRRVERFMGGAADLLHTHGLRINGHNMEMQTHQHANNSLPLPTPVVRQNLMQHEWGKWMRKSNHGASKWSLIFGFGLIAIQATSARMSKAETLDGFVTYIASPHEFQLGNRTIYVNRGTNCTLLTSHGFLIVPSAWYSGTAQIFYPVPKGPRASTENSPAAKSRPIPCDTRQMHIGSRIHLEGTATSTGFTPTRLVVYKTVDAPPRGVAFSEQAPAFLQTAKGWQGTLWVDGYPLSIDGKTKVSSLPAETDIHFSGPGFSPLGVSASSPRKGHALISPVPYLQQNAWVDYQTTKDPNGELKAIQIRAWQDQNHNETSFAQKFSSAVVPPDYSTHTQGSVQIDGRLTAAHLLPDQAVQEWVARLVLRLLPQSNRDSASLRASNASIRVWVTSSIGAMKTGYFIEVGGTLPSFTKRGRPDFVKGDEWILDCNHEGDIFVSPDGLILIPDRVLARLTNAAQAEALLSFAISAVLQQSSYRSWSEILQPSKAGEIAFVSRAFATSFGLWEDEQLLRLGIRRLFLAGYDLREAPFAWAVAQGKHVDNPILNSRHPERDTPWYTAYAFDYISRFYSDVDYSKLKRGKEEYAQFLHELREADPDAFEQK